jgi:hypothetical protein
MSEFLLVEKPAETRFTSFGTIQDDSGQGQGVLPVSLTQCPGERMTCSQAHREMTHEQIALVNWRHEIGGKGASAHRVRSYACGGSTGCRPCHYVAADLSRWTLLTRRGLLQQRNRRCGAGNEKVTDLNARREEVPGAGVNTGEWAVE